jgi:DEAD/H associated
MRCWYAARHRAECPPVPRRVDEIPLRSERHTLDDEVAAASRALDGHRRIGLHHAAAEASAHFRLAARNADINCLARCHRHFQHAETHPDRVHTTCRLQCAAECLRSNGVRLDVHVLRGGDYLAEGRAALGVMPSQQDLVLERIFDDTGGMQLVLHSPYGARINRGLGLALRKKFSRTFNFELQAAATDDAIVLSLGLTHSFPLQDVPCYLSSRTVADTWVLKNTHPGAAHFALEDGDGRASRWKTLRALRVLRWYER